MLNAKCSPTTRATFPEFLINKDATSGHFKEGLRMPAANLACWEQVRIPAIASITETLRYSNRAGTSEFLSAISSQSPEQTLSLATAALTGAGWTLHEMRTYDARIFTKGDPVGLPPWRRRMPSTQSKETARRC